MSDERHIDMTSRGRATILVVDDEPPVRAMLGDALCQEGFDVEEAPNGEAALALLGQRAPDLVLLDIVMPGIDGVETCRRIRACSDVPIIFLTTRGQIGNLEAGLAVGADDFCTKPVGLAELTARIRTRLRRS